MHRDVKPANLLIDDDGTVLLGDLGVAAFLADVEDTPPPPAFPAVQIHKRSALPARLSHPHPHPHPHNHPHSHAHTHPHGHHHTLQHHHHPHAGLMHPPHPPTLSKRKSFVGTPCYMAPEVINGRAYDASADIWSFGITALALTQGRAPRSLVSPQTALLQTVRDAAPTLERSGGPHSYSRALQEAVAACLEKDPAKRPTAQTLLEMPLFRGAKKKSFLVGAVLQGLPPLASRMERRRQPSVMTHGTMDSWDFDASAAASPNASVYSPRMLGSPFAEGVHEDPDAEAVGAGDDAPGRDERRSSAEVYALRMRGRHVRPHSRSHSVSHAEGDFMESASEHAHTHHPAPIAEVELPAANDASASDSESSSGHSSPLKAALEIPPAPELSSSPSGSSYISSNASASTSVRGSVNATPPYPMPPPPSAPVVTPARLWRKLTGKFDSEKGVGVADDTSRGSALERHDSQKSIEEAHATPSVGVVRKKFAILGRSVNTQTVTPVGAGELSLTVDRCTVTDTYMFTGPKQAR